MFAQFRQLWLRFSLRTLFVVMTVVCCWLGWELSVVRQRQALRKELEGKLHFQFLDAEDYVKQYPPGQLPPKVAHIPLTRTLLGDRAIQSVNYEGWMQGFDEEDVKRLKKVFPEAELREVHPIPCHPGCFPGGTEVDTPQGRRLIETLGKGDVVTAMLPSGQATSATVQSVFVTDNILWRIETDGGELYTTSIQPLCVSLDKILPAGKLQPGDSLVRRQEGEIQIVKVLSVTPTERLVRVFNVVLGDSEIFVANGFLARSKPPELPTPRSGERGHN